MDKKNNVFEGIDKESETFLLGIKNPDLFSIYKSVLEYQNKEDKNRTLDCEGLFTICITEKGVNILASGMLTLNQQAKIIGAMGVIVDKFTESIEREIKK